jgi:hypothetical protein
MHPWRFDSEAHFDAHCRHINTAIDLMHRGEWTIALNELDAALAKGESPNAHWNRSMTLLALGDYRQGFEEYESRFTLFQVSWERGAQLRRDLPRWHGEDLDGKRLVIVHECGFGDTIMLLRLVPVLRERGIDVALAMPPPLERLAAQLAPLVDGLTERDVHTCTYDLMRLLDVTPQTLPTKAYLKSDPMLREEWLDTLYDRRKRKTLGIAWSSLHLHPRGRGLSLAQFIELLDPADDVCVVSLQAHGREEAISNGLALVPEFADFAEVAALISVLDHVVSIDTAALHLAGALGHPDVTGVLPYVPCWRWNAPWYPHVKFCQQQKPGNWESAFAQI